MAGLLLALLAQAADPDLHHREDRGISIRKPAMSADWEFRPNGKIKESQIVVAHTVDDLTIEIFHKDLDRSKLNYDPKFTLEEFWKDLQKDPAYKEPKLVKRLYYIVLPGRAASGVRVWLLDMKLKREDGSPFEWKRHCFVGHENRSGYLIDIVGAPGAYEKRKKDVDLILSSIRTYRIPK